MVNRPPPGSMPGMVPPDVASMMEAGFAQQAQQQKTSITQAPAQSGQTLGQQTGMTPSQQGFQPQHTPRDLGSPTEELKMAASDVAESLVSIPQSILEMLGLGRPPKDPEEQSKLQQFHQGWQRLTADQQAVANQRIQAEKQRKEAENEMAKQKKEQQAQQKAQQSQSFVPQGKLSGQAALDKMQQDRKGMGGASG
ncbi:MAG: hypothetical protein ABI425_05595 [Patescibacteria group bacterium]